MGTEIKQYIKNDNQKVGLMVAKAVNPHLVFVTYSLSHPRDKFDMDRAKDMISRRIEAQRARRIHPDYYDQLESFAERAGTYFKDKQVRIFGLHYNKK